MIHSFEQFYETDLSTLNEQLEDRRNRYLRRFRRRLVLGALALILIPFYLPVLYDMLSSSPGERSFGFVFLTVVLVCILINYMVKPILYYRRHVYFQGDKLANIYPDLQFHPFKAFSLTDLLHDIVTVSKASLRLLLSKLPNTTGFIAPALTWEQVSVKELLFGKLFEKLGNFTYRPRGMNAKINLMTPLLLPPYDEYRAEDNVSGVFENVTVDIAEAQIIRRVSGARQSLFRGLSITIDLSEANVKLRAPFRGKTAVIEKNRSNLQYVRDRFKGFTSFAPQNNLLAEQFEVFTTDQEEAKIMVTERLLLLIQQLGELFARHNAHTKGWDDALWRFLNDPFGPKDYKLDDNAPLSEAIYSINNSVMMALNYDKVQITLPYKHHLFEAPSMFVPALRKEEIHLIYDLVHYLKEIIREVKTAKKRIDMPFPELDS